MNIFKTKFFIYAIPTIFLIGIAIFFIGRNGEYETVQAESTGLVKSVEISGKVVPAEEVSLSFSASSDVIKVYKDVGDRVLAGDILAVLNSSEVQSEVEEARANLLSAQAQLDKINGGNIGNSQITIAKDALVKTLNKAYVNADYIVRNNIDTFFKDADTINADFIISPGSDRKILNDGREEAEDDLRKWSIFNDSLSKENVSYEDYNFVVNKIKKIDEFLSLISSKSSDFNPNGVVTQAQIDSYVSVLGSSRSTISTIILEMNSALNALNNLQSDVPVQNANIQNSQASVYKAQARAGEYILRAPFDGVITQNNLEIGKYVISSDSAFILISNSPLEVETFIPEVSIVGIDIEDKVMLQFDALGEDTVVDAVVTHIDPKETIKDGVVTYRTKISLLTPFDDLRPGMSTNIQIIKEEIFDQIIIPTFVIQNDGVDFVEVVRDGVLERINIETGEKDNKGKIAVTEGLRVGDNILIPNK